MLINIYAELTDGTVLRATASSFERATEELAALERKSDKIAEIHQGAEFPF